ncbi:MAG: hypothetical protein HQM06_02925 [Magnetococcales bacterium]|nr:hypothetical protein [Magnetococcales bacterium]
MIAIDMNLLFTNAITNRASIKNTLFLLPLFIGLFASLPAAGAGVAQVNPQNLPFPPGGLFDYYQKQNEKNNKSQLFYIPRDLQGIKNTDYLANTCVYLSGLSIEFDLNTQAHTRIKQETIGTLFGNKFWMPMEEKESNPDGNLDQRHVIEFKHDRCHTKLESNAKYNKPFKAIEKTNEKNSTNEQNRLILQFEDGQPHWASLLTIARFVNRLTDLYRNDPEQPNFLQKLLFLDKPQQNYFLSRAYLPEQNICGAGIDEINPSDQNKFLPDSCRGVAELVKIDIINGHVKNVIYTNNKSSISNYQKTINIENKMFNYILCSIVTKNEKYDAEVSNIMKNIREHIINYEYKLNCDDEDSLGNAIEDENKVTQAINELKRIKILIVKKELYDIISSLKSTNKELGNKISEYIAQNLARNIDKCNSYDKACSEFHMLTINELLNIYYQDTNKLLSAIIDKIPTTNYMHNLLIAAIDNLCENIGKGKCVPYWIENELSKVETDNELEPNISDKHGIFLCGNNDKDQLSSLLCIEKNFGKPLTQHQLDNELILLGNMPGIDVEAVLEPGRNPVERGATNLLLEPKFQKYEATIGADNYGSKYMGPWLGWAKVAAHPFIKHGDDFSLLGVTAKDFNEFHYLQMDYRYPFARDALSFLPFIEQQSGRYGRFSVRWDDGYPGGEMKSFNVSKSGYAIDFSLGKDTHIDRNLKRTFEVGLNVAEMKTNLFEKKFIHERVSKLKLSPQYEYSREIIETGMLAADKNSWPGPEKISTSFNISKGIKFLDHYNDKGNALATRHDAEPTFTQFHGHIKISKEFKRSNYCNNDSMSANKHDCTVMAYMLNNAIGENINRLFVSGEFDLQYTNEPLPSPEEIGYGGRHFGTAFDISKIVGDRGYGLRFEVGKKFLDGCILGDIQTSENNFWCKFYDFDKKEKQEGQGLPYTPSIRDVEYSPFLFGEYAQVRRLDPTSKSIGKDTGELLDAGAGLRLQVQPDTSHEAKNKYSLQQISLEGSLAFPLGSTLSINNNHQPVVRLGLVLQFNIPDKLK